MKSIIYWHPKIYQFVMRLLYWKDFKKHYQIIANEIGNLEVLDICCGDCYLTNFVNKTKYFGLDINGIFIKNARKKGINAKLADIANIKIPKYECILLKDSLYQFIPNQEKIIKKILSSTKKKAIISEPIKNLAQSKNLILSFIGKKLTSIKKSSAEKRLSKENIIYLFKKYKAKKIKIVGRDILAVFEK